MDADSNTTSINYRELSLACLVNRIVEHDDREALREFHDNRRPFAGKGGRRLYLVERVNSLREAALRGFDGFPKYSEEVVDRAADLTIEKFFNLPGPPPPWNDKDDQKEGLRTTRTDCRKYLAAFRSCFERVCASLPEMDLLDEEALAARLLDRHLKRHFLLSLLECRRSMNSFVSRYEWRLDGKSLYVWFPKDFPGPLRRPWLEANIEDPDPYRPGERERVQKVVNRRLARGRFVPLEECNNEKPVSAVRPFISSLDIVPGIEIEGLAKTVAKEKASAISLQRPAIQALGANRLAALVLDIFEAIDAGEYCDGEIARRFGLSQSTLSRFAGSKWKTNRGNVKKSEIPDLWRNLAHVLAEYPPFVEVAVSAGVFDVVKNIAEENRERI